MRLATVLVLSTTLAAQSYPPAFPRTNATKLIETERIVVWDIVWPSGQPTALHRHVYDQVGTYYQRGGRRVTMPDGTARTATTEVGSLSTTRKGTTHIEEGITDPPLRAVFIELKHDTPFAALQPALERHSTFPPDGSKQLLDDDRVIAWDLAWSAEAGRYRPEREAVVVWLGEGRVRTSRGNATELSAVTPGRVRHMPRNSGDTIEVVEGRPRAIVFEFK